MKTNSKVLILLLLLLICGFKSLSQYYVIHVNGRIKFKDGEYIKAGSSLELDQYLVYTSSLDSIIAIRPDGKIINFSAPAINKKDSIANSLFSLFKQRESIVPLIKYNKSYLPSDLISENHVVIENTNKYVFDQKNYPSADGIFFIQIDIKGKPSIIRRLNSVGDTLIINYTDLITNNRQESNIHYTLKFHKKGAKFNKIIVDGFKPNFDVTNLLGSIMYYIIDYYKTSNISKDSIKEICLGQITEILGKPSSIDFEQRFNRIFDARLKIYQPIKIHGLGVIINYDRKNIASILKKKNPYTKAQLLDLLVNSSSSFNNNNLASPSFKFIPDSIFTLKQYTPLVGDQGITSTCTAWATAYAAQSICYRINHPNLKYTFSPEYIYLQLENSQSGCNSGIEIDSALVKMMEKGNVLKTDDTFNCEKTFTAVEISRAALFKIEKGQPLFSYDDYQTGLTDDIIMQIKEHLIKDSSPVIISIFLPARAPNSYTSFDSLELPPNRGIWQPLNSDYIELADRNLYTHDSHAMCIIGYNDNVNGGSFEVMNSWGAGWGLNGFFWLNYNDYKKLGIEAYIINNPKKKIPELPINKLQYLPSY